MILSACAYEVMGRKGILLFHQKSESATSRLLSQRIFDIFETCYNDVLKDQDSTRIPSADDMGEPEIQLLENAKARALRSLPQSSLYWGSDLYHLHINQENVFAKLPQWFQLHRIRNYECEILELDQSWTKLARNKDESFVLSPRTPSPGAKRIISAAEIRTRIDFRIANFLSTPLLNIPPALAIDSLLRGEA